MYQLFLENSKALEKGDETWETEIDGSTWSQKTFQLSKGNVFSGLIKNFIR